MQRLAAIFLLSGALLLGLAQVAQLPPWEGFDEPFHYSYIQQLAETGTWPRFGDPASADIDDYLQVAPAATSLGAGRSYRDFFAASPDAVAAGRIAAKGERDRGRSWRAGRIPNWEAQHPPLYYLMMAPAYFASNGWSLAAQLFLLRGLSYLVAWLGLCVAVFSVWGSRAKSALPSALILAAALWPALFPMWFPEMARLGNDSLVALIAACASVALSKLVRSNGGDWHHVALGAVLALGLLTKATFLPFVLVIVGLLAVRIWQVRADALAARRRLQGLFACLAAVTILAGWWYVQKLFETGSAIGSTSEVQLTAAGGLIEGLRQNASAHTIVRLPLLFASTFLWVGTWSFVRPPLITLVPLLLILPLLALGYARSIRAQPLEPLDWVAPATAAVFLMALYYHSLILIALGWPGAPTWYLHSLAPILAPLLGRGLAGTIAARGWRPIVSALMFYPMVFLLLAFAIQGLFFAGCGGPKGANSPFYDLSSAGPCVAHLAVIYDNLSAISFPQVAIVCFAVGWILVILGILTALRCMHFEAAGVRLD